MVVPEFLSVASRVHPKASLGVTDCRGPHTGEEGRGQNGFCNKTKSGPRSFHGGHKDPRNRANTVCAVAQNMFWTAWAQNCHSFWGYPCTKKHPTFFSRLMFSQEGVPCRLPL